MPDAYWALDAEALVAGLATSPDGLTSREAAHRLRAHGPNELREEEALTGARILWNQLRNPLLLLLVFAAAASAATGDWVDAAIVLAIVMASTAIGYSRERGAHRAIEHLRARVQARVNVVRDGRASSLPARELVPGDVVVLAAGTLVPADAVLLEATDLYVNEAVLTGESFPVEKKVGPTSARSTVRERTGCVHLGTNVRSGAARAVVVHTGRATQFGAIAHHLRLRPPETEFDRGIRRFGQLLTSAMSVLVITVFAANVIGGRPPVETLLFSIALAVGLSPELLPIVLSVNLARGAQALARRGVLVKRLNAIENLGSMDVLCTDKTGTLTEGVVRLEGAYDERGQHSDDVLELAAINAALQRGLANPLDEAITHLHTPDLSTIEKVGEVPYDFVRKRLSVVVRDARGARLVTKGAFEHVLGACASTRSGRRLDDSVRAELRALVDAWSREGTRVLAVATRDLGERTSYGREDEVELVFEGLLTFLDSPKAGAAEAISELRRLGVDVKLITGDVKLVAQSIASKIGLGTDRVLTGRDLEELHDDALWRAAPVTQLFVEVDPNQKERIILALKKTGHVVGFLGDGINDAPAMHAADTSLSVEGAADVARDAADFVLVERHLDVVRAGIEEGRTTFANTLKYLLTTMSANLGNMVSMAIASFFLPFLPLLAGQILLNNFLSDIPAIGLAGDRVDRELVARPQRWSMRMIGRFMLQFGLLSSIFDAITFFLLWVVFAAPVALFRTAWFVESLLTELLTALVVRTRRPFYRSRPGTFLLVSSLVLVAVTFTIPFVPGAHLLELVPLPPKVIAAVVGITVVCAMANELLKRRFFAREGAPHAPGAHDAPRRRSSRRSLGGEAREVFEREGSPGSSSRPRPLDVGS